MQLKEAFTSLADTAHDAIDQAGLTKLVRIYQDVIDLLPSGRSENSDKLHALHGDVTKYMVSIAKYLNDQQPTLFQFLFCELNFDLKTFK